MFKNFLIASILLVFSGCSHWEELGSKEKGAVIGAGVGAVIGSAVAGPVGTLVGGVGGGLAGGVLGSENNRNRRKY